MKANGKNPLPHVIIRSSLALAQPNSRTEITGRRFTLAKTAAMALSQLCVAIIDHVASFYADLGMPKRVIAREINRAAERLRAKYPLTCPRCGFDNCMCASDRDIEHAGSILREGLRE